MQTYFLFFIAALGKLFGCYAFWLWLRLGKSIIWTVLGAISLVIFAAVLTKIEASNAGRVYAAYAGIYIFASLLWLWLVEGVEPSKWDVIGVAVSLFGTSIILLGNRLG